MKGEAFFEVKSNPEQPFVVRMGEADIRVLGTSFNVMNYEDENRVEVALQTGKVNFTVNKTKQVYSLSPGNVVRMDKKNLDVQLAEEDVSMISACLLYTSGFEQERQAGPLRESGREHGGASAGFAPTNDVGGKSRAIGSYLGMELLLER